MWGTAILELKNRGLLKFLFVVFVLALIAGWLSFGQRGFVHLYRMEQERQTFLARIRALEGENQKLMGEINQLRSDKEYIEAVARRELSLIKDNEILYRFTKE